MKRFSVPWSELWKPDSLFHMPQLDKDALEYKILQARLESAATKHVSVLSVAIFLQEEKGDWQGWLDHLYLRFDFV